MAVCGGGGGGRVGWLLYLWGEGRVALWGGEEDGCVWGRGEDGCVWG